MPFLVGRQINRIRELSLARSLLSLEPTEATEQEFFSFAGERPAKEKHSALTGMGYEIDKWNI
jgi:hypothetical protein